MTWQFVAQLWLLGSGMYCTYQLGRNRGAQEMLAGREAALQQTIKEIDEILRCQHCGRLSIEHLDDCAKRQTQGEHHGRRQED